MIQKQQVSDALCIPKKQPWLTYPLRTKGNSCYLNVSVRSSAGTLLCGSTCPFSVCLLVPRLLFMSSEDWVSFKRGGQKILFHTVQILWLHSMGTEENACKSCTKHRTKAKKPQIQKDLSILVGYRIAQKIGMICTLRSKDQGLEHHRLSTEHWPSPGWSCKILMHVTTQYVL